MMLRCRWSCASPSLSGPHRTPSRLLAGLLVGVLVTLLGWVASPAHGQFVPVAESFVIRPVAADVTAGTAAEAQDLALLQAQQRAFESLADRLIPVGQAPPAVPDSGTLQAMVQGVEVLEEKRSAVRYIGRFAVTFDRDAVRRYFDAAGIPLIAPPEQPVVVLPVLRTAGLPILWDGRTDWRTAWEDRVTGGSLLPLLVPPGELQDVAAVTAEEALAGDAAPLGRIGEVYATETVVVAVLAPADGGAGRLELVRYEAGQPVFRKDVAVTADERTLEAAAVDRAVTVLEQAWKDERSLGGGEAKLRVRVEAIAGLDEFVSVRRRLDRERLVVRAELDRLTRRQADLTLHYRGSRDALAAALRRLDLALRPAQDGAAPAGGPGEIDSGAAASAGVGASDPVAPAWRLEVLGPGPALPNLAAVTPRPDTLLGGAAASLGETTAGSAVDAVGARLAGETLLPPGVAAGAAGRAAPVDGVAARPEAGLAPSESGGQTGLGKRVLDVDETDFRDLVANASLPSLVYFWAEWCSFCRAVDPHVAGLAEEKAGRLVVARVDVDDVPVLAEAYNITAIPAFLVLRAGDVVAQREGRIGREALTNWVSDSLERAAGSARQGAADAAGEGGAPAGPDGNTAPAQ